MSVRDVVRAAATSALLLPAACSSVEPLEPYTLRLSAYRAWAGIASGSSMATDPHQQVPGLSGDQMDMERDLGLSSSPGWRAALEARLGRDSEIRVGADRFHGFEGDATLDRSRRFDGTTYAAGTVLDAAFEWDRASVSYAHRIAALRGDGLPADVLIRVGYERDQFFTEVSGLPPPDRDRLGIAGMPLLGPEVRLGLASRLTLTAGVDAGYFHDESKILSGADVYVGLRWNVVGPLDLLAEYEFTSRHHTTQRSTDERTDVRLNTNLFFVGAALHF